MHTSRNCFIFVSKLLSLTLVLILAACDASNPTAIPENIPVFTPTIASSTLPVTSAGIGIATPSQGNHILFVEPDDGDAPVVATLNSAKQTIEMKMYLLSERDIIAALQAAKKRGVVVRVMLEEHPYGSGSGNEDYYKIFQSNGIDVKWTNPVFKLTHEKSFVVDGKTAIIMTLNQTHSAYTKNREYGILTSKPEEVQEVLAGFNADWNRSAFNPVDTSSLLWSNSNSRKKILAFIDASRKSLVMEQEEMQDTEVQQHIVDAVKRGVKVRVIVAGSTSTESAGQDFNQPGEQQIRDAGAQVKTINAPYMHAKIYLADNNRVIICSENVSSASLNNNRELGIMVSDSEIVQRVAQTFEKDWTAGSVIH